MAGEHRAPDGQAPPSSIADCVQAAGGTMPDESRKKGSHAGWAACEGMPHPLGATRVEDAGAWNFALYSKHATGVRLHLFAAEEFEVPAHTVVFDWKINKSGRVWHCRVPERIVRGATYYAYQVEGPDAPAEGHRFDRQKLLVDPYARAVFFPPEFSREAARHPGSNVGRAPLGVIPTSGAAFDWSRDRRPHHTHDAIIYEVHPRGFTRQANSGAGAGQRGTFAGLIEKIPYLRELGVTIVELMPVFQYDPQEGNYWGYMPMGFFALHGAYGCRCTCGEQLDEFRTLVKALHAADIEVVLDVVYNHSAEGNENGPTYSFRGIDNTTYYLLGDDRRTYRNDSGTGNVLHTANRYVQAMILDSLRYWVREFHVDGFRFDLASLFTRRSDGSINLDEPPLFGAIQGDPDLADVRLIAEAWDLSSYQLGRSFPGTSWQQWNGQFRDRIRQYVRGDPVPLGDVIRCLYGSDDLFPDTLMESYRPFQSVNLVTSHDGFTLYDLVSYDRKHNEANGEGNRDGTDANYSWNCGWEGDDGVPAEVVRLRHRQARNFFCLLILANGTPLIRAGDEFLGTQRGNNNAYNQDNETSWLDWELVERNADFLRFSRMMIAFRTAHPSLGRSRFWRTDVHWYGPRGAVDFSRGSRSFAYYLDGRSQEDDDLYVMVNMSLLDIAFTIQAPPADAWRRTIDTAVASPLDIIDCDAAPGLTGEEYVVQARSVVVLLRPRK